MAFVEPEDQYGSFEVVGSSGSKFVLLTQEEADYFLDKVNRYMSDHRFGNISDLQDLDRIIQMETLSWRWGIWLSQERDYWGQPVDLKSLRDSLQSYSTELRQLKKMVGIDKSSRERDKGESVVDYIENLRLRAKEFGVMRENQLTKAITLWKDLEALVVRHLNCDEKERQEQSVEIHDILEWLTEVAIPEFNKIDEYFAEHSQRFWIRTI